MRIYTIIVICIFLTGCSTITASNKALINQKTPYAGRATFEINEDRGRGDVLMILSLSGGGSRAAYFAGQVMLRLQEVYPDIDLLKQIDVISAVSGGSLAAAYYAISADPDDPNAKNVKSGRIWDRNNVENQMAKNYLDRFIANSFWPANIFRYWFTSYNRSDIMAQTLADNMYDQKHTGIDLLFEDLNPNRPYLILNSTEATSGHPKRYRPYSHTFTFTYDEFKKLGSDINAYEVARAVMGSAAFPGAFNYVLLKDYNSESSGVVRHVQVFDGGTRDNLGLYSVMDIIEKYITRKKPSAIIVILVDAFTKPKGMHTENSDPRTTFLDRFVDTNFIDAFDSLLVGNRQNIVKEFRGFLNKTIEAIIQKENLIFWSIQFDEMCAKLNQENDPLCKVTEEKVNKIATSFNIEEEECKAITDAVKMLMSEKNSELNKIRKILLK